MSTQERRIAVIIDTFDEYCQTHILDGLYRAGSDAGFTLVTFPVVSLLTSDTLKTHYDFFKEMINPKTFEGVIVFTGALSEHTDFDELKKLIKDMGIPSVSVAGPGGSCASIEVDNRAGVYELMEHLITAHNAERIACISGPQSNDEARERFEAYKESLNKHHLPQDDLLIYEGDFSELSGVKGVRNLISKGFDFDSIICADDITAIGALKELKNQEIFVPDFVTVSGFDDIDEASMYSPSLTTIRQPFAELGTNAVRSLKDYFDLHRKNGNIKLPTEAVIRESCGCIPEEIRLLRETSDIGSLPKRKWLTPNATEFLKRLSPTIDHEYRKYVRRFGESNSYNSFLESSCSILWNYYYESTLDSDNCDHFIHSFSSILAQHSSYSKTFHFWEKVLSELNTITSHISLNSKKSAYMSRMLQEARIVYVSKTSKIVRLREQFLKEKGLALHEACEHIMNSSKRTELIPALTEELLELNIVDAALVLFPTPVKEKEKHILPKEAQLELLISNARERQINTSTNLFDTSSILPEEVYSLLMTECYILLPLYFKEYYFGYITMTIDKRNPRNLYEDIRFHVSLNLYQEMLVSTIAEE